MLVMSRKKNESIVIELKEGIVELIIVEIRGDKVRLGVESPKEVPVHRREVYEAIQRGKIGKLEETTAQTVSQQSTPAELQITPYLEFVKYLHEGNFTEAGKIYAERKNFEASPEEKHELIKGLYQIVRGN